MHFVIDTTRFLYMPFLSIYIVGSSIYSSLCISAFSSIYNRKTSFYIIGKKNIILELDISYLSDMFYMFDMLYMSYQDDMYYQDDMFIIYVYVYNTIVIYLIIYN